MDRARLTLMVRRGGRVPSLRSVVILAINAATLGAFAVWLADSVSLGSVAAHFVALPPRFFVLALSLNVLLWLIYGWRMERLLDKPFGPAFAIVMLGFGFNGILPFRLGEAAKIAYAQKLFRVPVASLLSATVIEKLLDLAVLGAMGFFVVASGFAETVNETPFAMLAASFVLGVCGVAILIAIRGLLRSAFSNRTTWLIEAAHLLGRKASPRALAAVVPSTVLIWTGTVLANFLVFSTVFGTFSVFDAVILTLILSLAIALPGAPAGLGAIEAGIVGYLHAGLGVDGNQALAAAAAFHFMVAVPQVLAAATISVGKGFLVFRDRASPGRASRVVPSGGDPR